MLGTERSYKGSPEKLDFRCRCRANFAQESPRSVATLHRMSPRKPVAAQRPARSSRGGRTPAAPSARSTRQRRLILELLNKQARPLSPAEVHVNARRVIRTISLSTVYRTLRLLEASGEIRAIGIPGQVPRYEPEAVAAHHHHHFHCRACDRVFDVHGCPGGMAALVPSGFRLEQHTLMLMGTCKSCTSTTRAHRARR